MLRPVIILKFLSAVRVLSTVSLNDASETGQTVEQAVCLAVDMGKEKFP